MNLSIVIITKNEEHNIERCIKSCLPLQAQIIVLDSQSTDNTVAIAEGLGASVHSVEWQGYGATKNQGAQLAQHEWILSLDADEALDVSLLENIKQVIDTEDGLAGYWMHRSFIFNGQQLFYGALKNERRLRLYDKRKMHWNLNSVHEDLVAKDNSIEWAYGELQGSLLHYSYKNLEDMKNRLDRYAKLSAERLSTKGKMYLVLKKIFAPSFSFLKNYIARKGFLDGRNGLLFAQEQARYVRNKYKYALQGVSS